MKRSRWLPALGLLASVALVWSVTAGVLWQADGASALLDNKFTEADRLLFYRVEPGASVRLKIPAGAEAVRVVTHLVLPGDAPWTPDRQHLYGLGVRLSSEEGTMISEGPLFTRTRQSKADRFGETWLREAAFSATPGTQLGDEREFIFDVPAAHRENPVQLELRYPATEGAVLLRVYARFERGSSMLTARNTARLRRATARAERGTFLWWDKLDPEARQRLMDETWERLDPLGDPGRDFVTEPVYRTEFRLPYADVHDADKERLPAGRAVALNVMGPAQLDLWLWKELGGSDAPPGPVSVGMLSLDGVESRTEFPIPRDEAARQPLEVPAGVHTVTVKNVGGVNLRFAVEGPRWAQLGADEAPTTPGPSVVWVPDLRRAESWATGPACEPLELELPSSADGMSADDVSRLVRIDARVLSPKPASTGALTDEELPTVTVVLLDEKGGRVGEATFGGAVVPDAFETVLGPPRAADEVPCAPPPEGRADSETVELTARPLTLSEPLSARMFAPGTARRMQIRSTHPVAVSLYAFLSSPQGAQLEAPYDVHRSPVTRWRNAPYRQGQWHLLRPGNHRQLSEGGGSLTLLSQVRLEPAVPAEGEAPSGTAVALYPAGAPMSREVLEPDLDLGDDARGSDPLRGVFTRLSPNKQVRVFFEGRTPSRPELRLDVDDLAALGSHVRVRVDGEIVKRFRLRTARTRELLPPIRAGVRELLIEADSPGVSALLNRGPVGGRDALRMRTVYRVSDGLRVPVKKKGLGATTLNIVVYTQEPGPSDGPRLKVTIDGGHPKRQAGMLAPKVTRAVRELPWAASRKPSATMTGAHKGRWYPRTVTVTLGEDLAPGVHWVEVRPLEGKSPAWARFFVFDGEAAPEPNKRWSRPGWDVEDAP